MRTVSAVDTRLTSSSSSSSTFSPRGVALLFANERLAVNKWRPGWMDGRTDGSSPTPTSMDGGNRLLLMWDQPRSLRSDDDGTFFFAAWATTANNNWPVDGPTLLAMSHTHTHTHHAFPHPVGTGTVMWVETFSCSGRTLIYAE